ncbi:MAG TPA: hypothetical protein VGF29_15365 [Hyphomicrobiaceae bacterium]|jgi:hypothetical protein
MAKLPGNAQPDTELAAMREFARSERLKRQMMEVVWGRARDDRLRENDRQAREAWEAERTPRARLPDVTDTEE